LELAQRKKSTVFVEQANKANHFCGGPLSFFLFSRPLLKLRLKFKFLHVRLLEQRYWSTVNCLASFPHLSRFEMQNGENEKSEFRLSENRKKLNRNIRRIQNYAGIGKRRNGSF
jgi:hypothetical protein